MRRVAPDCIWWFQRLAGTWSCSVSEH